MGFKIKIKRGVKTEWIIDPSVCRNVQFIDLLHLTQYIFIIFFTYAFLNLGP